MPDEYGAARTNFFRVRDPVAFKAWAAIHGLTIRKVRGTGEWAVYSAVGQEWPAWTPDPEAEDGRSPFDIVDQLGPHVVPGSVVVWLLLRVTRARILIGQSGAFKVTEDGFPRIQMSLDEINRAALAWWGIRPGPASG